MSHVIYYQNNPSIHLTDGVTVTSLSAALIQKIHAATYHLCQNAFMHFTKNHNINSRSVVNFKVTFL